MSHPTPWEFHPVHHPSYIDFFEQVLADTTDPVEIEQRYEKQYAEDEWYRHLYRTSYAYHGVHPFYMWYWGSHGLAHLGKVIIVGGEPALGAPPRVHARLHPATTPSRWPPTSSGRDAHHHPPPQPADRDGRRHVKVPRLAKPPVPVLGAHRARRRGAARAHAQRSAPTTTPTGPAASRPGSPAPCSSRPCCARPSPPSAPRSATASTGSPASRDGPVIFAGNHHSHLDTPVVLTSIPEPWRYKVFVGAAADYFFRTRLTVGRLRPGARRHPDRALQGHPPLGRPGRRADRRRLVDADLPRGRPLARRLGPAVPRRGRLPRRAAARCRWCPLHLEGTAKILRKGAKRPTPAARARHLRHPAAPRGRRERRPATPSASSGPSPSWPTRPPPTGGTPASGPPPAPPRRSPARTPRRGGGPGPSATAPGSGAARPAPGPSSDVDRGGRAPAWRWSRSPCSSSAWRAGHQPTLAASDAGRRGRAPAAQAADRECAARRATPAWWPPSAVRHAAPCARSAHADEPTTAVFAAGWLRRRPPRRARRAGAAHRGRRDHRRGRARPHRRHDAGGRRRAARASPTTQRRVALRLPRRRRQRRRADRLPPRPLGPPRPRRASGCSSPSTTPSRCSTTAARSPSGPTSCSTSGSATAAASATPTSNAEDRQRSCWARCSASTPRPPSRRALPHPARQPVRRRAGVAPEIWLLGVRNPFRIGADPATGDLWLGDVGQTCWEELDRLPTGAEGAGGVEPRLGPRRGHAPLRGRRPCPADALDPVQEHPHGDGWCGIVAGYVLRASAVPALDGRAALHGLLQGRPGGARGRRTGDGDPRLLDTGLEVENPIAIVPGPDGTPVDPHPGRRRCSRSTTRTVLQSALVDQAEPARRDAAARRAGGRPRTRCGGRGTRARTAARVGRRGRR